MKHFLVCCLAICTCVLAACAPEPQPISYSQASALVVPPQDITTGVLAIPNDAPVDFVIIQKSQHILSLWKNGQLLKTYPIMAMGANPVGKKMYEGDERTPEGQYYIDDKHVSNKFQKFLNISYPNDADKKMAKKMGVPAGGHVGIHGDKGGMSGFFQRFDKSWTDGCIAMRNADVEDIFSRVEVGTPILIKP